MNIYTRKHFRNGKQQTNLIEIDPFELTVRVRTATGRRDLTVFEILQQSVVRVDGITLENDDKTINMR